MNKCKKWLNLMIEHEFDIAAKNETFLDSNRKPKCQNNKSYNCVTKKRVKKLH